MIVKLLSGLSNLVLTPIFAVLSLVVDLSPIQSFIQTVLSYVQQGMGIVNFFCPVSIISPALTIAFSVYALRHAYGLFMWAYTKIPFLGVK